MLSLLSEGHLRRLTIVWASQEVVDQSLAWRGMWRIKSVREGLKAHIVIDVVVQRARALQCTASFVSWETISSHLGYCKAELQPKIQLDSRIA